MGTAVFLHVLTRANMESWQFPFIGVPNGRLGHFLASEGDRSQRRVLSDSAEVMQQRFQLLVLISGVAGGEEAVEIDFRKRRKLAVAALRVTARVGTKEGVD